MFAYYLSSVQGILTAMREIEEKEFNNLEIMNQYMHREKVSMDVQKEVKKAVVRASDELHIEDVEKED